MRSHWRTCSLLAGGLLAFACGDPDLKTDLDSEGPPEVNTVTVTHEGAPLLVNGGAFFETPIYCRDDGGRLHREICPDEARVGAIPVNDTIPFGFQTRIVFSELLDPSVEVLEDRDGDGIPEGHIDTTSPVSLTCGGADVAYDGFYDPSGNDVTAPPGPSLVVSPINPFPAATGTECQITVGSAVTDKDGNGVPAQYAGPHSFTIAPLSLIGTDPSAGAEGVEPAGAVLVLAFNAPLDPASVAAGDVTLEDGTGPVAVTPIIDPTVAPDLIFVVPNSGNLDGETTYTLTLVAGAAVTDALGGALVLDADVTVTFTTGPAGDVPDAGVDAS
jgi:hypothetical protein